MSFEIKPVSAFNFIIVYNQDIDLLANIHA